MGVDVFDDAFPNRVLGIHLELNVWVFSVNYDTLSNQLQALMVPPLPQDTVL